MIDYSEIHDAVNRLLLVAKGDTGQSRRAANFLLAWWNAEANGGFDLTDLWNVDAAIAEDMLTVFSFLARSRVQEYPTEFVVRSED